MINRPQLKGLALLALFTLTGFQVYGAERGIGVKAAETPPHGAARTALVIGNGDYQFAPLRNPANDARAMAAELENSGFAVQLLIDATQRTVKRAINRFGSTLRENKGVGLFYYAGHGMQVGGRNFMVPIGAKIETEEDVEIESVDVNRVLAKMDAAGTSINIVILDACRNNPFARSFRSSGQGLAMMDAPTGTIIAYATAPGAVARDGDGRNGLYTSQLVKHIATRGLRIEDVFKRVRSGVRKASNGQQIPWESSSLEGDFYFSAVQAAGSPETAASRLDTVAPAPAASGTDAEEAMWKAIESSRHADDFQDYLRAYPQGRFSPVARVRLRQLQRAQRLPLPAGGATGPSSTFPVPGFDFNRIGPLSGTEIRAEIWRKPVSIFDVKGATYYTYAHRDGSIVLGATNHLADRGRWRVQGDTICYQWRKLREGKRHCSRLFRTAQGLYRQGGVNTSREWRTFRQPLLSRLELEKILAGRSFWTLNAKGNRILIRYSGFRTVSVETPDRRHEGKWWIVDHRVCTRIRTLRKGRQVCFIVIPRKGGGIAALNVKSGRLLLLSPVDS